MFAIFPTTLCPNENKRKCVKDWKKNMKQKFKYFFLQKEEEWRKQDERRRIEEGDNKDRCWWSIMNKFY